MTRPSLTGPTYDSTGLRAALGEPTMWRDVRVVQQTGSTSSDLAALARAGAPEGTVVVADHQVTGRGRLDRTWHTPPGTGIAVSMLFRPNGAPPSRWPWLSLIVGVGAAQAVRTTTGVEVALKWPNDVMVGGKKIAGILAESVPAAGEAVVVGLGLNVSVGAADLPPTATSLDPDGDLRVDRMNVLAAILRAVDTTYGAWRGSSWDPEWARDAYRPLCSTLGATVRVSRPAGGDLIGEAVDVDIDGRLVVRTADADVAVSVGDVVHVRSGVTA